MVMLIFPYKPSSYWGIPIVGNPHRWLVGGWAYHCEKYDFVSWDDEIPNWMESHKIHVPKHQAVIVISHIHQPNRYWTNNCTNFAWTAQKRKGAPPCKSVMGVALNHPLAWQFFWDFHMKNSSNHQPTGLQSSCSCCFSIPRQSQHRTDLGGRQIHRRMGRRRGRAKPSAGRLLRKPRETQSYGSCGNGNLPVNGHFRNRFFCLCKGISQQTMALYGTLPPF